MGLFSRKSKEEKQAEMSARMAGLAAERPFEAEPYDGEPFPGGSFGAIPVPGRLMVPLRPGKYKVVYRVKGNPAFHDAVRGTGRWEAPTIDFSIKPADDATPRLSAKVDAGNGMINSLGWSTMRLYRMEVPEPGGTYEVIITGEAFDKRAHLRIED